MRYLRALFLGAFIVPAIGVAAQGHDPLDDGRLIQSNGQMQLAQEQGSPVDPDHAADEVDSSAPGGDMTPSGVDTEPDAPIDPDRVQNANQNMAPGGDDTPEGGADSPELKPNESDRMSNAPDELEPGGATTPEPATQ